METIAGMPFFPLEITKEGTVFDAAQKAAIETAVKAAGADKLTDLFVISHGWNNDKADACSLYDGVFNCIKAVLPRYNTLTNRKFAVVGVFWPSKKFADSELIPAGGAASLDDGADLDSSTLKGKLGSLKNTFDNPASDQLLEQAKGLVDGLDNDVAKQNKFVEIVRSLVPRPSGTTDTTDDASDKFFSRTAHEMLEILGRPMPLAEPEDGDGGQALNVGDDAGAEASIGDFFEGIKAGAWRLLNFATYYQMKERAGIVGRAVNGLLASVRNLRPDLRLHLIGHSFGARVVTAAVDGAAAVKPSSLSLLQGAFSHNGFTGKFDGTKDGFFRNVIAKSKVVGPILATHTVNDKAVGIAYPLASRLSQDNAKAFGDENDQFGGIGRNGAVKMKPDEFSAGTLLAESADYHFVAKKVHNLRADQFIHGHSDIENRQVANAILSAVNTT
jgi:hypothetical protein